MSTVVLRPRTATLAAAALVVAVCALTLTLTPTPLVLPVVVGVAGWSAARLVVGPRADSAAGSTAGGPTGDLPDAPRAGSADVRSGDAVGGTDDGLLRATLPVVLGTLALLGAVLLAAALGWRIDTPAITVAAGLVALGLLGTARWRTLLPAPAEESPESADSPRRESPHTPSKTQTRRVEKGDSPWAGGGARVVAAGLVLAAATAAAVALQPVPVERYTQLALDPGVALAGAPVAARPDAPVTLAWSLAGYGGSQDGPPPPVAVTVGGAAARDLRVAVEPPSAADPTTGAVDVRPGTVTFRAPATEGLYPVHVTGPPSASRRSSIRPR